MEDDDVVPFADAAASDVEPYETPRARIVVRQYDPFARGIFPVGVRTLDAVDAERERRFPCEIWYPAAMQYAQRDLLPETQDVFMAPSRDAPRRQMAVRDAAAERGTYPLIVYSHSSGSESRRSATFLSTHLASHGYLVAALDHSEVVAPELAPRADETKEERAARAEAWLANRVPDIRFLLNYLFDTDAWDVDVSIDFDRVGIVGHSFGGWTALAATGADSRIRAVVALAPGGSSKPKPGILPAKLDFDWTRDVPVLYLVGEDDVMTPLEGMQELFQRTQATKQMIILRRADHCHFMDDVEEQHEAVRTMTWGGDLSWIPTEMRPIAELCSGDQAHVFVRGLTVCHFDAVLKGSSDAQRLLSGDIVQELVARGIEAVTA